MGEGWLVTCPWLSTRLAHLPRYTTPLPLTQCLALAWAPTSQLLDERHTLVWLRVSCPLRRQEKQSRASVLFQPCPMPALPIQVRSWHSVLEGSEGLREPCKSCAVRGHPTPALQEGPGVTQRAKVTGSGGPKCGGLWWPRLLVSSVSQPQCGPSQSHWGPRN